MTAADETPRPGDRGSGAPLSGRPPHCPAPRTDPGPSTAPAIEEHALLSYQRGSALVTREGRIDWLCMPRFDSAAQCAALLGNEEHGHWSVRIAGGTVASRRYLEDTMVLETTWTCPTGTAVVTDFMSIRPDLRDGTLPSELADHADLYRIVRCTEGSVQVEHELRPRFQYGSVVPFVQHAVDDEGAEVLSVIGGETALVLHGALPTAEDHTHRGTLDLAAGERAQWVLTWHPSWSAIPVPTDADEALDQTREAWTSWLGDIRIGPRYDAAVRRSLLVLKSLTYGPSGGIVAAPTASLPEDFGGERNWDYRYCWLRDAALSIEELLTHGHTGAAAQWRDWLLRAIAGDPEKLQIMYGIDGGRRLDERTLDHLPGYADSRPVHVGNGAATQFQGDVLGEVMIAFAMFRDAGIEETGWSWWAQRAILQYALDHLDDKDQGLWEMRGDPAFFTHSRVMMWAAFDRGIAAVEEHGMPCEDAALQDWNDARARLREEILARGLDETGSFTQSYGSSEVDASLLQIPHTGFLPADDPRMLATVARIEEDLLTGDGLLLRYRTVGQDGLAGEEHPFLICSFWLVEQYAGSGRLADAEKTMERTVACGNDLHLFAEEYDGTAGRMAGNFPQAFSHLGLIRAADVLERSARSAA